MSEQIKYTPAVEIAKSSFLREVEFVRIEHPRVSFYPDHVCEVEKWAELILRDHPQADREVVFLGVWLHDVGNLVGDRNIDHAIRSEEYALNLLLEIELPADKISAVAHCVRAHRNKDISPVTIEAQIVAAADSASHMTGDAYLPYGDTKRTVEGSLAKLERDYRDINLVPGLREKLTPIYEAWINLLTAYPQFD